MKEKRLELSSLYFNGMDNYKKIKKIQKNFKIIKKKLENNKKKLNNNLKIWILPRQ